MKTWSKHPDLNKLIYDSWQQQVHGFPMFVFAQKLKNLKFTLKDRNKRVFGNMHHQVKDAIDSLDRIQKEIDDNGGTESLIANEKAAQL